MEAKRILLGKAFLLTLAFLIVLNGFFFVRQQTSEVDNLLLYGDIYHEELEALAGLSPEDAAAQSQSNYDHWQQILWDNHASGDTPETVGHWHAANQLQEQFEHLSTYEDYLADIRTDAARLQGVSLFADPNSEGYKNTVKTVEDFSDLEGLDYTAGHDLAVTTVFNDRWADYSIVILMAVVCALFLSERKTGLWPMVYGTPGGRARLAWRRVLILFIAAWVGSILILGSKIILSGYVYHGLGEWDRILQSIPMFYNVPIPMTVGQFWLFYLTVKALGAFLMGLVLWAMLSGISHIALALCAMGLFLAVEYVCTLIPSSSAFVLFRYCNVLSYVDYVGMMVRYVNVTVLGMMVSGHDLVLLLLLPLCLAMVAVNGLIAQKKRPIGPVNRLILWVRQVEKRIDLLLSGGTLLGQEMKKLLFKRRGLIILILLALVLLQAPVPQKKYDPLDMYYEYYEKEYAGPITAQTAESFEQMANATNESDRANALRNMAVQATFAPEGAWIVPTAPYEAIWSSNEGNYHRSTALTSLLFLVLLLSPIAAQENQADIRPQQFASPAGRGKLWRRKALLTTIAATVVWAMVYGTELILTEKYYGAFQCLEAPIYSLLEFQSWPWNMTLGQTMALYYGLKLLVMVSAAQLCLFLSSLCRKNTDGILVCAVVLVLPAALATIGSDAATFISFLLPLGCVEVFGQTAPFILVALVGLAACVLSWYWQAKKKR